MSNLDFSETRMGHEFYEGTMKKININLGRIADALEKMVENQEYTNKTLSNIETALEYLR